MDFDKHALILEVIRNLSRRNCATGKTNVQKSLAITNEVVEKTPFEFILYKHGPYSFDVRSELEKMKSYSAVVSAPNENGFGVSLREGRGSRFIDSNATITANMKNSLDRVCDFVCGRGVIDLERLATAAWIRSREGISNSTEIAKRMNEIKPHVTIDQALEADRELTEKLLAV